MAIITADDGNNNVNGTADPDVIVAYGGDDTIDGGAGDDVIDGGDGSDAMMGGLGNDVYVVDSPGDVVIEIPGQGSDVVFSSISYALPSDVEVVQLTGVASINASGNTLDNLLVGNAASNILEGREGNDTLEGGAGADILIGGTGSDSYAVDDAGDVVIEIPGQGTDVVFSSISYALPPNVEVVQLTGGAATNATGNRLNNVLVGNFASNILDGGEGNDLLEGGAGADILIGGKGSDSYGVDDAGDVVVEAADDPAFASPADFDIVYSHISYALPANVEGLQLLGSAALQGTGNDRHNILAGNAGNNVLVGGAGNDVLDGFEGADHMIGGEGQDEYWIDNVGDVAVENAGEGERDRVTSTIDYILPPNVEELRLIGTAIRATGNAAGNSLAGNELNNVLDGGAGGDLMEGGFGNDSYVVDSLSDRIFERDGEGVDIVFSSITYSLAVPFAGSLIENLQLTGDAAIDATGNGLSNVLIGNAGNNAINGGAETDHLDGGAGADALIGGFDDDLFMFRKGEANGDSILDFLERGAAAGDRIAFSGYGSGSVFGQVSGVANLWSVIDAADGSVEYIYIAGAVDVSDYTFL